MPTQLLSAAGFILAVIAGGMALYHWRRATSLYSLLVEGANRFEEMRQRGAALEQTLLKTDEKFKQQADLTKKLNASLEEAREKCAELSRKVEQKEHETRLVSDKLELQKGHLERQLVKAQEQIRAEGEERAAMETQMTSLRAEMNSLRRLAHEEKAALSQELTLRDKDWQARLYEAEKAKAAAEKQAKIGDPTELRRLKRKVAQYDRLYSSMKGLREMSEERNRNWEVALQKLSVWILEEKSVESMPSSIGPLVGAAMEAIGAQLIDEAEITPPAREGGEMSTALEAELEEHAATAHAEG